VLRYLFGLLCLLGLGAVQAQSIESVLAPGPVIQGHVKVEQDCKSCHSRFDRGAQDGLCTSCHKDVGEDMKSHTGLHGRREQKAQCRTCHTEHHGRNASLVVFDAKNFDHKGTDFERIDKHADVDCVKCHAKGKRYREAPNTCSGCHTADDIHKGGLGKGCDECHNARGWKETSFDHGKKTRFTLNFKHAEIKCVDCHVNGRYKDTPRTCFGCHRKDDETKGHKGQYGEKCETCHDAKAFKPSIFNHDVDTHYVLKDKHRAVKCTSCHTGPIYRTKTGSACIDCHAKDDKHKETLGRKCADCHTEKGWKDPPGFDHAKSRFPLLGSHAKVKCQDCHADQLYRKTPSTCIECHRKDDKHEGNLGTACADCHQEQAWKTAPRFDHDRTKFQLRNAHAAKAVKCRDCHETLKSYRGTRTECLSCHRRDDKHQGTLGEKCEQCHRDVNWRIDRFDHAKTRFPLAGRHLVISCQSCHTSLRFKEAPGDCYSCHRKDDHHKGTLGVQCATCHNVRAWPLWDFNHDRNTKYRLEGRHVSVACIACHARPAPPGKPIAAVGNDCYSCHRKDDTHEGRFGRRCEQCHLPQNWRQVRQAGQAAAASAPVAAASATRR
jgi:hypothetical protein